MNFFDLLATTFYLEQGEPDRARAVLDRVMRRPDDVAAEARVDLLLAAAYVFSLVDGDAARAAIALEHARLARAGAGDLGYLELGRACVLCARSERREARAWLEDWEKYVSESPRPAMLRVGNGWAAGRLRARLAQG